MISNSVFLNVRAMVNDRAGNQLFVDSIVAGSAIQSIAPKLGGRPGSDIYLLNGQAVTVSDSFSELEARLSGQPLSTQDRLSRVDREAEMLQPPSVEQILADLRQQKANAEARAADNAARDAEVRRRAAEEGIELEEPEPSVPDMAEVIDFPGPADDILDDDDLDGEL